LFLALEGRPPSCACPPVHVRGRTAGAKRRQPASLTIYNCSPSSGCPPPAQPRPPPPVYLSTLANDWSHLPKPRSSSSPAARAPPLWLDSRAELTLPPPRTCTLFMRGQPAGGRVASCAAPDLRILPSCSGQHNTFPRPRGRRSTSSSWTTMRRVNNPDPPESPLRSWIVNRRSSMIPDSLRF
jgi:hypothetical protein